MNEYELTVSSKIEKEYFIEADCYEDAIQKAVDYYLADNEEVGENKITNINVELKTSEDLEELGIEYKIDTNIVRGLDYYTKTVFEFVRTRISSGIY